MSEPITPLRQATVVVAVVRRVAVFRSKRYWCGKPRYHSVLMTDAATAALRCVARLLRGCGHNAANVWPIKLAKIAF